MLLVYLVVVIDWIRFGSGIMQILAWVFSMTVMIALTLVTVSLDWFVLGFGVLGL